MNYSPVWLGSGYYRAMNDLGTQLAWGVADGLELRFRYDRLWFRDEGFVGGNGNFMFTAYLG